jgi:hypothetical protein
MRPEIGTCIGIDVSVVWMSSSTGQYHFPCSHYVVASHHRNFEFESRIPWEFSVESLICTWSPRFEPFLDESQWPTYTVMRTSPAT